MEVLFASIPVVSLEKVKKIDKISEKDVAICSHQVD